MTAGLVHHHHNAFYKHGCSRSLIPLLFCFTVIFHAAIAAIRAEAVPHRILLNPPADKHISSNSEILIRRDTPSLSKFNSRLKSSSGAEVDLQPVIHQTEFSSGSEHSTSSSIQSIKNAKQQHNPSNPLLHGLAFRRILSSVESAEEGETHHHDGNGTEEDEGELDGDGEADEDEDAEEDAEEEDSEEPTVERGKENQTDENLANDNQTSSESLFDSSVRTVVLKRDGPSSQQGEDGMEKTLKRQSDSEGGSHKKMPFRGVPGGVVDGTNITHISYMIYKIVKTYDIKTIVDIPCRNNLNWFPKLLPLLDFEVKGLNYICVDENADSDEELHARFASAGSLEFLSVPPHLSMKLPKSDLVFSFDGPQQWGVKKTWAFFKGLRKKRPKYVIVTNNPGHKNDDKQHTLNLRKQPFHFSQAMRVISNVQTSGNGKQLVFYETDGIRDGY